MQAIISLEAVVISAVISSIVASVIVSVIVSVMPCISMSVIVSVALYLGCLWLAWRLPLWGLLSISILI